MSGFQAPITVKSAIDKINKREIVLPDTQRKFIWKHNQIELLFDSIMKGYPINSFMFWEVKDSHIKSDHRFYDFIQDFREFYKEENPEIKNNEIEKDFYSVIDGQQRLASIFIGLKGSYAYKRPSENWEDNEDSLPTRHLYINIQRPVKDQENEKTYDFRFLSKDDLQRLNDKDLYNWYKVGDILKIEEFHDLFKFIADEDLVENKFAIETLSLMFSKFNKEAIISYYLESEQNFNEILEIFTRTNVSGALLSF